MKLDPKTYRLIDGPQSATIPLVIGIVGLVLSAVGYFTDATQFFHSYLVAFFYWLTIGLGALFFVLLHHLVDARWSIVVRRMGENVMSTLPLMVVFVLPLLFGIHDLFHWSHEEVVANDAILQAKAGYLNVPFFIIRQVIYFAVWIIFARLLYRVSMQQDAGSDKDLKLKMRKISAPGILLFALSATFVAFDWLMSLDPHWYSTIFGVYVYAGSFLASLSFLVLLGWYQRSKGLLADVITAEHYHDIGKLMFGFIIFWAYMAFSQYFLIWYANVPEETVWYLERWEGSWKVVSLVIIFGHFTIPFLIMIFRESKRNLAILGPMAIWLLLVHWVDMYWIVFPNIMHHGPHLSWMDAATMAGIGGIFVWYVWRRHTSQALVPVGDPGLQKSIEFTNS